MPNFSVSNFFINFNKNLLRKIMIAKNAEFQLVKFPFINFKIKIYIRKLMRAKIPNFSVSNFFYKF